ncbi:MAG: AAA family ATPase [Candidatus Micrarchaeota archaeon]
MKLNLCGIPGAGKSAVAQILKEKLGWQVACIDELRNEHKDEKTAWEEMRKIIEENGDCIIDSSGLHPKLEAIRDESRGKWMDILIKCTEGIALKRIGGRKKGKTYFPYKITYKQFISNALISYEGMKFELVFDGERASSEKISKAIYSHISNKPCQNCF